MKQVPHWQWLVILYLVVVGIPVFLVHAYLKKRAFANRTFANMFLYFIGVIGTGYIMHSACIWFYFTFFFKFSN
jgi:hypothetical protein